MARYRPCKLGQAKCGMGENAQSGSFERGIQSWWKITEEDLEKHEPRIGARYTPRSEMAM